MSKHNKKRNTEDAAPYWLPSNLTLYKRIYFLNQLQHIIMKKIQILIGVISGRKLKKNQQNHRLFFFIQSRGCKESL